MSEYGHCFKLKLAIDNSQYMFKLVAFLLLLTAFGEAQNCDSNCLSCNNDLCLSCKQFFFLHNNTCTHCPQFCTSCTSFSSCQSCVYSYFSNGVSCQQCSYGCIACTSNTTCTSCSSQLYLSNNFCYQCKPPCHSCSSPTVCISCISNYYMSNSTCVPCDGLCASCQSQVGCTSCSSGYHLVNQVCKPCQSYCGTCSESTSCISCISGYYLVNNLCLQCNKNCSDKNYCISHHACPAAAVVSSSNLSTSTSSFSIGLYVLIPIAVGLFLIGCMYYIYKKRSSKSNGKESSNRETIRTITSDNNHSDQQVEERGYAREKEDFEKPMGRDIIKSPEEQHSIETN